jgi:hypothetical protein
MATIRFMPGDSGTERSVVREGRGLVHVPTKPSRPVAQLLHDAFAQRLQQLGIVGAIDYEVYAQPLTAE